MCARDAPVAKKGVISMLISMTREEMVAKKEILCGKHYPKCITNECPLAKYLCYDKPNILRLYRESNPAIKRKITRILKAVE